MNTPNLWICALLLTTACGGGDTSGGIDSGSEVEVVDSGASIPTADASLDATVLDGWCSDQEADFSFFVTSMDALWKLSGSASDDLEGGFGGDFGGIAGADEICQTIASATGHGDKTWHAFLSATDDGSGAAVHAIERIGAGPWSDANGRLVASGLAGLAGARPDGDAQSVQDLPDECGVPISFLGDAHDVVTASDRDGRLASTNLESTCNDWTTSDGTVGSTGGGGGGSDRSVMCGHSFPRNSGSFGANWVSDHAVRGCGKGANLIQNGAGEGTCIGCSGGYGALYCFAQ
mgnify:CR=1 FL=1|tara:strand:- start:19537 stop:20409 length:873 start_codon:yes stop_codon:yes gene_type:complete